MKTEVWLMCSMFIFMISQINCQNISPVFIQDIAYYLRSYKFNEWDAGVAQDKSIHMYEYFPAEPMRLHWEVKKYCSFKFRNCIEYLHDKISTTSLVRIEDTSVLLNFDPTLNRNQIEKKCKENLNKEISSSFPFEDSGDRYMWTTSALYFMCWFTMKSEKLLEHFYERCDNFAACWDDNFGSRNYDPRANDERPFLCSWYSFCPDPCCPQKHMKTKNECLTNKLNPCYALGTHYLSSCSLRRSKNMNFLGMTMNQWNVTCNCKDPGFIWNSKFGLCVDIDECSTKKHNCDTKVQSCINLPGTYDCFCFVGYEWNVYNNECVPYQFIKKREKPKEFNLFYFWMMVEKWILSFF